MKIHPGMLLVIPAVIVAVLPWAIGAWEILTWIF